MLIWRVQNISSDNCLTNQHPLISETLAMLLILRQVWQPGCRGRAGRLAAKRATRVPGRRPGPGSEYAAASHFLAKTNVWGLPQMLELVTTCPNVKMVIINMVVNPSDIFPGQLEFRSSAQAGEWQGDHLGV